MIVVLLVGALALMGCNNNMKKEEDKAPLPPTLGYPRVAPAPTPTATSEPAPGASARVAAREPTRVPRRVPMQVPARVPMQVPAREPLQVPPRVPAPVPARVPVQVPVQTDAVASGKTYILKRGDTLSKIARERYGDIRYLRNLINANPGIDHSNVHPGQKINLP